VAGIEEAYLFNVDDLTAVLDRGREARDEAAPGPAIGGLTRRVEELRQQELARSRRLVESLAPEQAEQLEAMTRAFAKKVLDGPLRAIREAARDGDAERLEALLAQWRGEDR
jgi:glutamyl-tRNA reductase